MKVMRKIAVFLGVPLVLLVGVSWLLMTKGGRIFPGAQGPVLVQVEDTAQTQLVVSAAGADAFLNVRGAPMILTLGDAGAVSDTRRLRTASALDAARFPAGSQLLLIESSLLDQTQMVQLAIPSSGKDLAAFNARRRGMFDETLAAQPDSTSGPVAAGTTVNLSDDEGSWGEVIGGEDQTVSYVETVIENTTTTGLALVPEERPALFRETLEHIHSDMALSDILLGQGVSEAEVARIISALERDARSRDLLPETFTKLTSGSLVATRLDDTRFQAHLLQMSLYGPDAYFTTLTQPRPGRFEPGADPWFSRDLRAEAKRAVAARGAQGTLRLKDAIYSTALRNEMPSDLVGELLVMLARVQDLDQIADEKDQLRILYAPENDGTPAGRIAYAGLTGPEVDLQCYVSRETQDQSPFACFDPRKSDRSSQNAAINGLIPGFIVPVSGTKTSDFGPRFHPILKKTVNHNGLDWGAPTGTPIHAAAPGKVVRREFQSGYGNVIYIDHADGFQSRYAHMNAFAAGVEKGQEVAAGELIGYVGTTGRSTGPHLHFEIRYKGDPINPAGEGHGSQAVQALVSQIIHIESAGNARAQNPRSSAMGLGQFIDSTWLRMMRTYRPDLARSLSRKELLNLRFDPTLSREMVTNLARENEAYLRRQGHRITPGRLYLAHFLGPMGADRALSTLRTRPDATVLEVMGASVVGANPFLRGWTIAEMNDWSERKMGRPATPDLASPASTGPALSAALEHYIKAVDGVLDRI